MELECCSKEDHIGIQLRSWRDWQIGLTVGHERWTGWFMDFSFLAVHVWARTGA